MLLQKLFGLVHYKLLQKPMDGNNPLKKFSRFIIPLFLIAWKRIIFRLYLNQYNKIILSILENYKEFRKDFKLILISTYLLNILRPGYIFMNSVILIFAKKNQKPCWTIYLNNFYQIKLTLFYQIKRNKSNSIIENALEYWLRREMVRYYMEEDWINNHLKGWEILLLIWHCTKIIKL